MLGWEEVVLINRIWYFFLFVYFSKVVLLYGEWVWGGGFFCGEEIGVLVVLVKI